MLRPPMWSWGPATAALAALLSASTAWPGAARRTGGRAQAEAPVVQAHEPEARFDKGGNYIPGSDGTFAQNYQDVWIVAVARHNEWDKLERGFFLDLGAYKGFQCSNTALLEQLFGWTGICVEGNLRKRTDFDGRRCMVIEHPLSDKREKVKWFGTASSADGQLQHINKQAIDYTTDKGITKETRNMPEVLDEAQKRAQSDARFRAADFTFANKRFIPFVSMDVEGFEPKVLSAWPWDRIEVGVFVVEGHDAQVHQILELHGYKSRPVQNAGVDTYWVPDKYWAPSLEEKKWRVHPKTSEC